MQSGQSRTPTTPTDKIEPRHLAAQALEFDSSDLFRGHQEIRIRHEGTSYRLRITRNGKLILNK
jgi:hemin uptake protein HemP